MVGCPDANQLSAFVEGRLPDESRPALFQHLDRCDECRQVVATACAELHPVQLPRGTPIGRYILLQVVGAGSMGVVYAAYDPDLDRKVALKLLSPLLPHGTADTQARLQREAQAMARLSHPNVITVHDVGRFADQVFIAMEFVVGQTLKTWLHNRRSLAEILVVFLAAGRGLAAAHAAGLVHRDFKPDNILVGEDGRVCVTDFGLARSAIEQASEPVSAEQNGLRDSAAAVLITLTATGALVGTPAYMAPEQLRGEPIDARADQFSFCVALYEAVYGQRPFAAASLEALRDAVSEGGVRPPAQGPHAPAWLRRLLLQGLAPHAADRHSSMAQLLTLLARRPRVGPRHLVAVAGVVGVAAMAALGYGSLLRQTSCRGAERKLVGIWDKGRKQSVQRAFLATKQPFAATAYASAARFLDSMAYKWAVEHTEACEATRHGEQSPELLDLRMLCLEQERREMAALIDLFAAADASIVEHSIAAASHLFPSGDCSSRALRGQAPPPRDPTLRAKIRWLAEGLAEVRAARDAGRYEQGLTRAREIATAAKPLNYAPFHAAALRLVGELADRLGQPSEAAMVLNEALVAAEAGRDDVAAIQTLSLLTTVVGYRLADLEQGLRWSRLAYGILERIGGDVRLEATVANGLGVVHRGAANFPEAIKNFERSLQLREKVDGPDHPEVAEVLTNMGYALRDQGEFARAAAALARALQLREKYFGADHPLVAVTLNQLGVVYRQVGRLDDALRCHERARVILERTYGPEHLEVAFAFNSIGNVLAIRGHWRSALDNFRSAFATGAKSAQLLQHPEGAMVHFNEAEMLRRLGRLDEAETTLRASLALLERTVGPDHLFTGMVLSALGSVLGDRGQSASALVLHQRALTIMERKRPQHPDLADPLTGIGQAQLALGQPAAARPVLERALLLRQSYGGCRIAELAETQFALARALGTGSRSDRQRAKDFAVAARDGFAQALDHRPSDLAAIDSFLARLRTH